MPDLAGRQDEIGDLTRSLEQMTDSLSERMDAIERFAADVAHEIRNPLTSIRSAVETLDLVGEGPARERLTTILKQDVDRLDRLVTDIANAYLPTASGKSIPLTQIAKPVFTWEPGVMWREGREITDCP